MFFVVRWCCTHVIGFRFVIPQSYKFSSGPSFFSIADRAVCAGKVVHGFLEGVVNALFFEVLHLNMVVLLLVCVVGGGFNVVAVAFRFGPCANGPQGTATRTLRTNDTMPGPSVDVAFRAAQLPESERYEQPPNTLAYLAFRTAACTAASNTRAGMLLAIDALPRPSVDVAFGAA